MSFGLGKIDPNVTQNRGKYVGGSDVPTILGINKYRTAYELAQQKVGIVENTFNGNEYTEFGDKLEPQIRNYINKVTASEFIVDTFIDEKRHIRSNVDGIDKAEGIILEIKTHGKHYNQKVYEAQMQLYMWQTGCDMGWLALYERPENFDIAFDVERLDIVEVPRDQSFIDKILSSIETFQIRCEFLRDDPEMSEETFYTYGTDMDKYLIALQDATPKLLAMQHEVKNYEKQVSEWKDKLYEAMSDNDIKKLETPKLIITRVLPSTSTRFDSKRFKADHADLYDQYQKESTRKGYVKLTERVKESD